MDSGNLVSLAKVVAALAAMGLLVRQCRKPAWWPGRLILWTMNRSHFGLTTWGLSHVTIDRRDTILDVGCGGGRTMQTMAAIATDGKVYGIDYSRDSVAASRRTNAPQIAAGRVDVRHGSVSSLPFPDATFDLVTAVETFYYWPDQVADLREVLRVLKPGGRLVIIAETHGGGRFDLPLKLVMKLLSGRHQSVVEHRDLLSKAGFSTIEMFETRTGWLCAVAGKAA